MANQLDIIIKYLLDRQAAAGVEKGTEQIASDLSDVNKVVKALDKTFEDLEKQMKQATTVKDFENLERQLKDVEGQTKEVTKSLQLQAKVMRAEAAAITDDFAKARINQIKGLNEQLGGISRAGLGLGLGITGGIFAGAATYVKNAKEATDITRQWEAAQRSLEESGRRVGSTLAEQALPGLKQAAQLAGTASRFIQSHPDIVRAALKFGEVTIALSAVGLLVNKGVKLYADVQTLLLGTQELQAAKLQDKAADKQLAAATLRAKMAGIDVPEGAGGALGGAGGTLGKIGASVALYATTVLISAELGAALGNKIGEAITGGKTGLAGKGNFGLGDVALGAGMLAQTPAFLALKGLNALGLASDKTVEKYRETVTALDKFAAGLLGAKKILNVLEATGTPGGRGTKGTRTPETDATRVSTETLQQALKIYEDYKADDLKLVQDHYADRSKIISSSLQAEQAENTRYAASVTKVRSQTASALASAASDFATANVRAAQQYEQNRAQIVRDGAQEIERIQEQSQDRLRKLAKDHGERVGDLSAARDALGLVKEQRRYQDEVSEERRSTNQELSQRRRDIAQRLADLQASYEQERAQRLVDYQARVAEIQANARTQLAELQQQHQEELQKIREQKVAKLRELDSQFVEERKRRYQQFIQNLRDLDAGLLGETKLRQQYQAKMLTDLDAFLAAYQAKAQKTFAGITGAAGTTSTTTRMLEQLIGGQITPERLMSAAIYGGGGASKSMMYNDNRRIDSRISAADRERMRQDALSVFMEALQ